MYAIKEANERERERERELKIERWKQREGFGREMGEKYCVLDKLNHLLISNACNLTADQIDHIDSVYHRLRFLAIILKDLEEQQQQQHELNHRLRFRATILKNELNHWLRLFVIPFFDVQVPGQISSGISRLDNLFKPIEANVVQFYDLKYQIQLLQDFNDAVHSSMSMSMENRTMVDEEITVGFDDEALTIKELLAGGKKQLQIISIVGMPGLEEESWELLQRKVFQNESCPPELIEIGKQIMKKCEGLPLAIAIIAGLLAKNIKTQEWWKQVAQSVSSHIVSDPNQYLDTLALSYNHLPRHLKPCFLYLGAFPEDKEIPVQKLICLWVAEGCIQKIGQRSLEEVAEDYLMDLIQRSLVIVSQKRFDGRIKACRMHDLLRDLCLKKAREINFLQWTHNYKDAYPPSSNYKANKQYRLCINSNFWERRDHVLLDSYSPVVQSLLCFGIMFGDVYLFICWTFKLLRVLDTRYVSAFFLRELTQLVNLRYLAINLSGSCGLPPSISNLSNLETIIIISTRWIKVILPYNVWKIPKLRHLYARGRARYDVSLCSEEAVTDHNNPSILENLRTIASLDPCGHVQDLLARTPFLTKLGICGNRLSDSRNVMLLNLEFLSHLDNLMLDVEFSKLTNLQEVQFPKNVKRLSLKCTKIKWEYISILGMSLPNLELLKLENDAASGWQWATTDGGFPQLKFLKLSRLKVSQWITCSSHFPRLQHLLLDRCISLEEIPSSLGDIVTLQMIEVNYCLSTVVESARKIKEEQESIGNNSLKVLIRKYPWAL